MKHSLSFALAAAMVLTATVQAQSKVFESLTGWNHTGTSTEWTDDFKHTGSPFGKVDRLNSTKSFRYTKTTPFTLPAGTYVATARVMKFKDQVGVAPITMAITGSAGAHQTVLPVFEQKTDKWAFTPALTFTLKNPGVVIFEIKNTDTSITKQNYYFDSFRIGLVPEGEVLMYQSLTHNTHFSVHTKPWHHWHTPNKDSAFGEVNRLQSVWWLEFRSWRTDANKKRVSNRIKLQPGVYTFNYRLMRTHATNNAIFETSVSINGGAWVKKTWSSFMPEQNKWALTPNHSFVVTQKDTLVDFRLWDIRSTLKQNYLFDAWLLRRGAFDDIGTPCRSTLGETRLVGSPPFLGGTFTMQANNAPGNVMFALGLPQKAFDMTPAGMPNCFLHVNPFFVIGAKATSNVATFQAPVPNNAALKGAKFATQALTVDSKANAFGGVLTNGGDVTIGG